MDIVSPLSPPYVHNDKAPINEDEIYYNRIYLPPLIKDVENDIVEEFEKYSSDITNVANSLVSMSGKNSTSPKTKTKKGGKRKKEKY